jgi:3-hydroxyacyl-[acyl-carrier-protein] dehydratase
MNLTLDKKKILEIQNNSGDLLMIDEAKIMEDGKSAEGYKVFNSDFWFFKLHWPGNPNVPGAFQLECLSQLASLIILSKNENKKKFMYIVGHQYTKFKRKISPGEKLNIKANLISWRRGIGVFYAEANVDKALACKSEFTMILPDKSNNFLN